MRSRCSVDRDTISTTIAGVRSTCRCGASPHKTRISGRTTVTVEMSQSISDKAIASHFSWSMLFCSAVNPLPRTDSLRRYTVADSGVRYSLATQSDIRLSQTILFQLLGARQTWSDLSQVGLSFCVTIWDKSHHLAPRPQPFTRICFLYGYFY
jgi:hypothetical protein